MEQSPRMLQGLARVTSLQRRDWRKRKRSLKNPGVEMFQFGHLLHLPLLHLHICWVMFALLPNVRLLPQKWELSPLPVNQTRACNVSIIVNWRKRRISADVWIQHGVFRFQLISYLRAFELNQLTVFIHFTNVNFKMQLEQLKGRNSLFLHKSTYTYYITVYRPSYSSIPHNENGWNVKCIENTYHQVRNKLEISFFGTQNCT